MITLPYRIEDLENQVEICRSISCDNTAGVYEIERAFSLIGSICDKINQDLSECYKIKSDGNQNLSAVQAVLDGSRLFNVSKDVSDATTGINSKISETVQCESELKRLRREIEHILHTLKSQLVRLSSDESTDYQKVLSLKSYTLRPLLNDNFEGLSNIHMGFQNSSAHTSEKVKIKRVSNHKSIVSENNVGNLSPSQRETGCFEVAPQVSIPANSLLNERIVEGTGDESSTYAVRRRSGIPFFQNRTLRIAKLNYYSTEKERIDHTPAENSPLGEWSGTRGESKFIPSDETVKTELEKYGVDGIEYKEGVPDFSPVSETNVEIEMTSNRYGKDGNFEKCDTKCAEQWNAEKRDGRDDWTARDVAEWRAKNKYTWHECSDMKTCNLVPRDIHEACRHSGGVAECNKRDELSSGGVFDE